MNFLGNVVIKNPPVNRIFDKMNFVNRIKMASSKKNGDKETDHHHHRRRRLRSDPKKYLTLCSGS